MNYTAASAAALDDNVFYDSGREGRKIAHYSTFRTGTFSYATFPTPKCREIKQILFNFIFVVVERQLATVEVTQRRHCNCLLGFLGTYWHFSLVV